MVQRIQQASWQSWALGIFVTISGALMGWAVADLRAASAEIPAVKERVTIVETKQKAHETRYEHDETDLKDRLKRVEDKQDKTLDILLKQKGFGIIIKR